MDTDAPTLVDSGPLRYLLSVPDDGDVGPRAVLCFLHGYDEAAPMDIDQGVTVHGPLRPGNPARVRRDFIIVAPQLPRAGDIWLRHSDDVRRIVREVSRVHGGDPARTYLTGFSFGGNGVFDLAIAQPGTWAALWPVDPTHVPRTDPGRPVWLSIGHVARHGGTAFIRALGLRPPGEGTDADRIYLDEGQDHVGSARLAYADERIYDWLLARRLPAGG